MEDNEYMDDTESRFDWAANLIAQAETPITPAPRIAPVARIHPQRTMVTASRTTTGSFRTDSNILQVRLGADGMAIYNLRESAAL